MDFLNSLKRQTSILAVCYLLIGIFFVAFPGIAVNTMVRVIAVAALIIGIVKMVEFFSSQKYEKPFRNSLTSGAAVTVLALFMLIQPQAIVSIFYVIIGAALIINGMIAIQDTINLRHFQTQKNFVMLLLGIVTLLLGILVLTNPFPTAKALIVASGIFLMIGGITNLVSLGYIHGASKTVDKKQ